MATIIDPNGVLEEHEKALLAKKEGLTQLAVIRKLAGGFSGSKVILVDYSLEREQGYPRHYPSKVLKIGDSEAITQEKQRWETHIQSLPTRFFAQIQDYYENDALSCIEYSFTDDSIEHTSFKEFYKKESNPFSIIEELFSKTLSRLYATPATGPIAPGDKLKEWLGGTDMKRSSKLKKISNFLQILLIDSSTPGLYVVELSRTIPNPLWLLSLSPSPFSENTLAISTSVVHGDLNAENIRISKNQECCLIDFFYTGRAEAVTDYAKLESVVKFELLEKTSDEHAIKRLLEIEKILVSELNPSEEITRSAAPATQKAMQVVSYLRKQLQGFIGSSQGSDEKVYWLCLFSYALTSASYTNLSSFQRLYAFISAALIAEKHLFPEKDTDRIAQNTKQVSLREIISRHESPPMKTNPPKNKHKRGGNHLLKEEIEFVNRDKEIEQIKRTFSPQYLLINAPAGYGKSRLLKRLEKDFSNRPETSCLYLNLSEDNIQTTTVLMQIILQRLGGIYDASRNTYSKIAERCKMIRTLILLIDNAEHLRNSQARRLLNECLPELQASLNILRNPVMLRVISADRYISQWAVLSEKIIFKLLNLTPFDLTAIEDTIKKYDRFQRYSDQYQKDFAAFLMHETGGHPKCVVEILLQEYGQPIDSIRMQKYHDSLIKPFIEEIIDDSLPPYLPEILQKLSVLRKFKLPVLEKMIQHNILPQNTAPVELENLLRETRLLSLQDDFLCDDIIRRLFFINLRKETLQNEFIALCREATHIYEEYLKKTSHRPDIVLMEALYQELQLSYYRSDQNTEARQALLQDFFKSDGILHKYLQIIIQKPEFYEIIREIRDAIESREDWEFESAINFFLRQSDHYTDEPYEKLKRELNTFLETVSSSRSKQQESSETIQRSGNDFQVFLAYNYHDKQQVKVIGEALKQRGITYWIDDEQIPPGRPFQDSIQAAIPHIHSAAVFIGQAGLGKWQVVEIHSWISQCVKANIPVIPVLLPGVGGIPDDLLFLNEFNWVQFHNIDNEEAMDNLIWGITGNHPKRV